jgi:thymidylate synthase
MSEQQYLDLCKEVIDTGSRKTVFGHGDKYIISKFGAQLRFDLQQGFPIFTTKKVFWRGAFEEMLWFIEGSGDVGKLHRKGVKIWDDWAFKYYKQHHEISGTFEQFQNEILSDPSTSITIPIHYTNSTNWGGNLDQTKWIIDSIRKTPDRKSFLVDYWRPDQTYSMAEECGNESVVLPACHTHYSVNISNGKLSLMLYMRSWDLFLGAPFNVAQYALLTSMYAHCTDYEPGELVIAAADHHIYSDHIEQVIEQCSREVRQISKLVIMDRGQSYLQDYQITDFSIEDYAPHSSIKGNVTVVGGF